MNHYTITCAECGDRWSGWIDGLGRLAHQHRRDGKKWVTLGWWIPNHPANMTR